MLRSVGAKSAVVAVVLAVAVSGLALAGHGGKCTKSTEECAAAMREAYQSKGWIGIEAEKNEEGALMVRSVLPNSPAERAGIQAGDLLVSVNGVSYSKENEAKLKEMKTSLSIGSTADYGVKRGAETLNVKVTLERIPDTVLAAMIDKHAKEEHQVAKN
jgi:C-terminal processing protease CtpA/Prc